MNNSEITRLVKSLICLHMSLSENVVYPIVPNGFADQTIPMKNGYVIGNINPTFSSQLYSQYKPLLLVLLIIIPLSLLLNCYFQVQTHIFHGFWQASAAVLEINCWKSSARACRACARACSVRTCHGQHRDVHGLPSGKLT